MLNITKIPTSNTSLNFQSTSQSQNNYGGYGSKQAQDQAYVAAVQQSQKDNPDRFINPKTGKTYDYVNKTIQKAQSVQAQRPTTIAQMTQQNIVIKPINFNTQKMQQGPIQPVSKIQTMQGSVGISNSKVQSQPYQQQRQIQTQSRSQQLGGQGGQQSYNEWSGNVPGQISDKLLDTVGRPIVEMGQGQKNIVEDYYNMPGSIAGSGYEDKSLINQAGAKVFEGDFEGAGKIITSNVPRLLGELSIEIPLAVIPIGPALKLGKIGVQAVKTGIKILADPVVIKYIPKVKLQMLEKAIDAVNKGKSGAVKTVNVITKDIQKVTDKVRKDTYYQIIDKDQKSMWYSKGKPESFYFDKHVGDGVTPALRKVKVSKSNAKTYAVENLINTKSPTKLRKTFFGTDEIENIGVTKSVFNTLSKSNKPKHIGKKTVDQFQQVEFKKASNPNSILKDMWGQTRQTEIGGFVQKATRSPKTEWAFPLEIQKKSKTIAIGVNNIAKKVKKTGFARSEQPKYMTKVSKAKKLKGFSDTLKRIVAHPTIIKSATPAEKKIIEKAVDKVLLNGKTPTKLELNTVNKIVNKYIITPSAKVLNSAKRSKSVKEQNEVFSQFSKTSLTTNKKQIMKAKTDAHFGPNSYNKELSYTVLQEWDDPTIIKKFAIPDDYFKRTMVLVKRGEGTRGKTVASGAIMQDIKKSSGVVKIGDDIYIPSDKLSKMTSKLRGKEVRMTNELDIINKRRSPTNLKYTWNSPYSKRRTVAIITKNIKNTIIPPNVASNIILDGSIGLTKAGKAMPNKGYAGFVREGNLEDIFINRWGATNPKSIARTLSHESEHQAIEMTLLKDNIFNTKAQKFSKSLDTGAYQNKRFIGRMNKKLKSNERIEGTGGKRSEVNMFDSFDMFTPEGVNRKVAIRNAVNQQHKTFIKKEKKIKNIVNGVLSVSGGALPIAIAVAVDNKQRKQQVGTGPPGTTFKSRSSTASRSKKRKSSR